MARYYITEWDARYEVNDKGGACRAGQMKRSGPLEFIRLKVHGRSLGLGWRKLIAAAGRREAPGVFGIFCKLLELSGDADRDARGFVDDTAETPLDFILDLDRKQIDAALKLLCQVGWLIPAGAEKEERSKEEQLNSTQLNSTQPSGEFPGVPGVSGKFPEKQPVKLQFLDFVRLTSDEYDKLCRKFGKEGTDARISELNDGIGSKGYKYKSHYHTILSWDRKHDREASDRQRPSDGSDSYYDEETGEWHVPFRGCPQNVLDAMDEMWPETKDVWLDKPPHEP